MLERDRLWLGPWHAGDEGRRRIVRDPDRGDEIGVVRPTRDAGRRWWSLWSSAPGLELCETDDRALVMSLAPSRLTRDVVVVRDCDGNLVGKLRGGDLLDPWMRPFAHRDCSAEGAWTLRAVDDGRIYATCTPTPDGGDAVHFVDRESTNPFLRMLAIGSFLAIRSPDAHQ